MNMNELLLNNIRADMYFREELPPIKTWEVFIAKTIKEVKECTPWVTGTHTVTTKKGMCSGTRGVGTQGRPTRMWMHLVKLYTLKPTERQLESLVESKQSPFLRVLGFLYIRYCVKREDVWEWLSPYIDDKEKIQIERLTETFWPLGKLVRTLLIETKYYDTHLPRLPVLLSRQIVQGIKDWDKSQGRKEGEDPFGEESKEYRRSRSGRRDRDDHRDRDRDRRSSRRDSRERDRRRRDDRDRDRDRRRRSRSRDRERRRDRSRDRDRRRRDDSRDRR
mmetsp:Transcript_37481/g.72621  ORF Transcript_37481/g.72621 Transcript_37481/m.72621 type:complete len:277 (+) Transcript_37481:462-1292(+)